MNEQDREQAKLRDVQKIVDFANMSGAGVNCFLIEGPDLDEGIFFERAVALTDGKAPGKDGLLITGMVLFDQLEFFSLIRALEVPETEMSYPHPEGEILANIPLVDANFKREGLPTRVLLCGKYKISNESFTALYAPTGVHPVDALEEIKSAISRYQVTLN